MRLPLFFALLTTPFLTLAAYAQTLEQMAGQMVMIGFVGDSENAAEVKSLAGQIADGTLGGVMYLKTNVKSLASVKKINAVLNAPGALLRPLIALDQEGGQIERLTSDVGFAEIPSAERVAASKTPAEAERTYGKMAGGLADLGFTLNLGPVVDLNVNPDNPIIARYGRAFSADAPKVVAYATAFIAAHHKHGLLTVLKHFPGHGSSLTDSHEGFVDISATWDAHETDPYRDLIAAGAADLIMAGHLYHKDYDRAGENLPASLSPDWIDGLLRQGLGYNGVVISDDLEMAAIRDRFDLTETVVRAVNAGTDILLFSNTAKHDPDRAAKIRAILVEKAGQDAAFRTRIEQSYQRIARLKSTL